MAMRTSLTTTVGALLAGFLFIACGSAPVHAHAGHNHASKEAVAAQLPVRTPAPIGPFVSAGDRVSTHVTDSLWPNMASTESPPPLQSGTCCCGSIACHAGLNAPAIDLFHPRRFGQRMRPARVVGAAKTVAGGVERPPRGLVTL